MPFNPACLCTLPWDVIASAQALRVLPGAPNGCMPCAVCVAHNGLTGQELWANGALFAWQSLLRGAVCDIASGPCMSSRCQRCANGKSTTYHVGSHVVGVALVNEAEDRLCLAALLMVAGGVLHEQQLALRRQAMRMASCNCPHGTTDCMGQP